MTLKTPIMPAFASKRLNEFTDKDMLEFRENMAIASAERDKDFSEVNAIIDAGVITSVAFKAYLKHKVKYPRKVFAKGLTALGRKANAYPNKLHFMWYVTVRYAQLSRGFSRAQAMQGLYEILPNTKLDTLISGVKTVQKWFLDDRGFEPDIEEITIWLKKDDNNITPVK